MPYTCTHMHTCTHTHTHTYANAHAHAHPLSRSLPIPPYTYVLILEAFFSQLGEYPYAGCTHTCLFRFVTAFDKEQEDSKTKEGPSYMDSFPWVEFRCDILSTLPRHAPPISILASLLQAWICFAAATSHCRRQLLSQVSLSTGTPRENGVKS